MCGIAGALGLKNNDETVSLINKMNGILSHRGPDDNGIFIDDSVAFGHRRLAIIDLSKDGHQPMFSYDRKLSIIFNGEIYNYKEVKAEIQNNFPTIPFHTNTDTEVILNAYKAWGDSFISKLNGMFAFAIYNSDTKEVDIYRDRLGEKPLYYTEVAGVLYFASEIRALLQIPNISKTLNAEVLPEYINFQTVYAPNTIVKNIFTLMPASRLKWKEGKYATNLYWDINQQKNNTSNYSEIKKEVYNLLYNSVSQRLIADVPFGAFLSGGIDSSAIVGLMRKCSNSDIKTFSVVFDESEFSEAKYARKVAEKFNTVHTEIKLTPDDFKNYLPQALAAFDHPGGDGPNTFVVSKVTKEAGVTMALSGLGGDEIFAGYNVFKRSDLLHKNPFLNILPPSFRKLTALGISALNINGQTNKIADILKVDEFNLASTYPIWRKILSDDLSEDLLKSHSKYYPKINYGTISKTHLLSAVSRAEISTYMQNILLRDSDQMSMASALEVRVPFLDHKLVEYVLSVPDEFKYPSTPKKLLVDSLEDLLPSEIVNRPKMGFTLPWNQWLKNDLKQFCEERIYSLAMRPYFHHNGVKNLWKQYISGSKNISWVNIWYLVVLEDWMQKNNIE